MTEKIKECFIIMPISNNENYSEGHFNRVYSHLIIPACELAGFKQLELMTLLIQTILQLIL